MNFRLLLVASFAFAAVPFAESAVVYSGLQNIPIPFDFNGVYLRIDTHATSATEPGDWSTAPWINLFFGGSDIGNDNFLRPVIAGVDRIVNLTFGTPITTGSNFVGGASGSSAHIGPAADQFHIGVTGYIGYKFQLPGGGGAEYNGWMAIQPNTGAAGTIIDWAYQNTAGAGIAAGAVTAVPEPAGAIVILPLAILCVSMCIRRQRGFAQG